MVGVIDVILDVVLSIFSEEGNKKIDNSSFSPVRKNILRVLIVLASFLTFAAVVYLLIKLIDK